MSLRIHHGVQLQQSFSSDLKLRCYTCLCLHRKLKPLEDRNKYLLALLCPEMFQRTTHNTENLICWECEFMTVKIKRFQARLIKACLERERDTTFEGLSNLKRTKIEVIGMPPQIHEPMQTKMSTPFVKEDIETMEIEIKKEESGDYEEQLQTTIIQKQQQEESSEDSTDTASEADTDDDPLMTPSKINKKHVKKQIKIEKSQQEAVPNTMLAPNVKFDKQQNVFNIQTYKRPVKLTAEVPNLITNVESNIVLIRGHESFPITLKDEPNASIVVKGCIPTQVKGKTSASHLLKGKGISLNEVKSKGIGKNVVKGKEMVPIRVRAKGNIPLIKTSKDSILTLSKHNERVPSIDPVVPQPGHEQTSNNIEGIYGRGVDEAKCKILNRTELNEYREKKRSAIWFRGWKNKCDRCIERFNTQENLDEHNKKHDESRGPFICDVCEQRFDEEHLRNDHCKMHFVIYECLQCQYQHHDRIQISEHIRRKHEVSSFECSKCDAVFKSFKEKRNHTHHVHGKRGRCEECNKTFLSISSLKVHMANLHRKETAECPICKKKVRKNYLEAHKKKHDPSQEDGAYCVVCEKTFKTQQSYERHLKFSLKHNKVEEIGLKCDHCDKYFPSAASLRTHTEEISGVKFKCHICNKESKNKVTLGRHIRAIHMGLKPQLKPCVCEYCGKSFTIKKSLEQHINKHLGKRPLVCKDCGATFVYSAALFTHRRLVHKVKRKYEMTSEKEKV